MNNKEVLVLIEKEGVEYVDICFIDLCGKLQYVIVLLDQVDEDFLEEGFMFDGLLIVGWKVIDELDMKLMLDVLLVYIDLFYVEKIIVIYCDVVEFDIGEVYVCCLCQIVKKVEVYLKELGIGDVVYFGLEVEFFLFDDVCYLVILVKVVYQIDVEDVVWNIDVVIEGGNFGYCLDYKGGYFLVNLVDFV